MHSGMFVKEVSLTSQIESSGHEELFRIVLFILLLKDVCKGLSGVQKQLVFNSKQTYKLHRN